MLKRVSVLAVCFSAVAMTLCGCGSTKKEEAVETFSQTETERMTEPETVKLTETELVTELETVKLTETELGERTGEEVEGAQQENSNLDDTQRNSINMLNYLTVLTKEINDSSNSRLFLEEVYTSLLNNTYPNAVDARTQVELQELLDILETYRMLGVKRERLQNIYEQNCAQAIRAAIPNPMTLLSAVEAGKLEKSGKSEAIWGLVGALAYMAVDSYTSYTAYIEESELQYLQDGWELDDEANTALHNSRSVTFDYMMDMVREFDLPGDLTLYEAAVDDFVSWKSNSNVVQRIQFYESNKKQYEAFGPYWLELAKSYYENGNYSKCISCIESYELLDTRIFRKDYELAKTLPYAIAAAAETLEGEDYVEKVGHYIDLILANSDQEDWALRYLAAQTYLDLYAKTSDNEYLRRAYDIILNNVNCLVNEQREMNAVYLAPVVAEKVPKGSTKEAKAEIENYNKQLNMVRKKELPPIYEPLYLNCELLFALAEQLEISDAEKSKIDDILHENGNPIFMICDIDNKFRFTDIPAAVSDTEISVDLNKGKLTIPAKYVSSEAEIIMTITTDGEKTDIHDWTVSEVKRKEEAQFDTFMVIFTSEQASGYRYSEEAKITICLLPKKGCETQERNFEFVVDTHKGMPDVWKTYYDFKRVIEEPISE